MTTTGWTRDGNDTPPARGGIRRPRGRMLAAPAVLLAGLMASTAVRGQEQEAAPLSLADVVYEVRDALGYDLLTLAALGVEPSRYDAITGAVIAHARSAGPQLTPAIRQRREAARALTQASRSFETMAAAVQALQARSESLASANETLAETLRARLSPAQQAIHDRLADNRGLDPLLALVGGLTEVQREQLKGAQIERDRILHHPRNWHRQAVREEAVQAFDKTVGSLLTPAQLQELQRLGEQLKTNGPAAVEREESADRLIHAQVKAPAESPEQTAPPVEKASAPPEASPERAAASPARVGRVLRVLMRGLGQTLIDLSEDGGPVSQGAPAGVEPDQAPDGGVVTVAISQRQGG